MQNDDAPPYQRAEEDACNAFCTFEPHLEQTFTKRLGVRFPLIGTQCDHAARQHDVARSERVWLTKDLLLHRLAVVTYRVVH